MKSTKRIWQALFAVFICSFSVLLYLGSEIYQEAPPIPERIQSESGKVIFTKEDIEQGQLVWRSMGGHQNGSIWGHGSLLAPDWNADWLHREALASLELLAKAVYNESYNDLTVPQQKYLQAQLQQDIRTNRYNPATGEITVSDNRAQVILSLSRYYQGLFSANPQFTALREQYALKEGVLKDEQRAYRLSAFFFWSTWATVTERPGKDISYTSNWPYEPLVANEPDGDLLGWSMFSIILMIAGIGALVWYHASLKHEPLPTPSKTDPLLSLDIKPSQRAVFKYFLTAIGLFLLQITLGGITAHYAVEGQEFYGYPLAEILPYAVTRTWHTQLAVFWIATAWLGTGLFIAPALSNHEPKFQKLGVNVLWVALLVVVLGSMFGEWYAAQQIWDLDTSYWFGHQGYEFVDLGRIWQILLLAGLLIWLALITRAILPALSHQHEHRPVVMVLFLSSIAIGLFYGVGLMMGKHTHLAIAEYWRWWVVHLWVEGFFETFAAAVVSLLFVRLGLIRAKSANTTVLFTTVIFLTGGIIGTLHHLYFGGTPTSVIAWGASFSALEVVPLALIGFEAFESYKLGQASPWMTRYKWAIMFFVACSFWNLVGAGVFGFLINPPISLYYIQGLNITALHAHTAFMGVYGMLGIGLILFCVRPMVAEHYWNDKLLKYAFWTLNLGLAMMAFMSLLPVGVIQFNAVMEQGYWYARSPEIIHSAAVESLVWWRLPGDVVFAGGGGFIILFMLNALRSFLPQKAAAELTLNRE
ncbi:nitric-oxide reductase large subunit [Thalassomonas actiniarum]|uniref:Nitric-oxide reductase large subunit n=1 Tax=Thalassomonas actiniarum TaxID=485447 RepID=A0AAE9YUC8_9GAMM|nr:nitric-oxide reductase large subunit [Thalassomonas actiniarum]WDE00772.1 nitric-oxide reductase large subunit [Thalassomonas actiniarum]